MDMETDHQMLSLPGLIGSRCSSCRHQHRRDSTPSRTNTQSLSAAGLSQSGSATSVQSCRRMRMLQSGLLSSMSPAMGCDNPSIRTMSTSVPCVSPSVSSTSTSRGSIVNLTRRTVGGTGCCLVYYVPLVILLVLLHTVSLCQGNMDIASWTPETPKFTPSDLKTFSGTPGHNIRYFRYMTFDVSDKLYVGAMNHLIELNPNNIASEPLGIANFSKDQKFLTNKDDCTYDDDEEKLFPCQNHIRAVFPHGDGKIHVCGTASFYPVTYQLDMANISASSINVSDDKARGICSRDPLDSCTAIYVPEGNPGNEPAIYSAAIMDFAKTDPGFSRPKLAESDLLRTDTEDVWLNKPVFVATFDVGDYVYLFLRELAIEYTNCGRAIYSRVARVCKNDTGGSRNVLKFRWTTFFKARLDCSIPGDIPFYFNELHDVYREGSKFWGVFTTNLNGLHGSAVCAFTLENFNDSFDGPFKEQPGPNLNWVRVLDSKVPTPRPGVCTRDDEAALLEDSRLHFIKARPMMDQPVQPSLGRPQFHLADIVFTRIAVQTVPSKQGVPIDVFFLAQDDGSIHKIISWNDTVSSYRFKTVAIWDDFTSHGDSAQAIQQMKLRNDILYLSTDYSVFQLSIEQCAMYEYCTQCVQDPHCGWSSQTNTCIQYTESNKDAITQDVTADIPEMACDSSCKHADFYDHHHRIYGDAVHLNCSSHCEPSNNVEWYHDNALVDASSSNKYFLTAKGGLIVLSRAEEDTGVYECRSNGIVLTKHQLHPPGCNPTSKEDCWKHEFRNWCQEYDNYKEQMEEWSRRKNDYDKKNNCTRT